MAFDEVSVGDSKEQVKDWSLVKVIRILPAIWLFLGAVPLLIAMIGYEFLPSIEWTARTNILGVIAGLVTAVSIPWPVLKGLNRASAGEVKKFFVVAFSPILGYVLGKNVILVVPMLLALIAGHRVELPFTVLHADRSGSRGCRSKIEFQELPFLFNRICGVPADVRQGIGPGRRIIVIGRGNSFGVYADKLRLID
ncbi:hypothetical protein [Rhizobium sullae]|uniref:Transmembrane protein n=1 Tax=Rhizobium sullae TaxID=50338 RepID=A0A4R3PUF2_RHISU|nr:hypothetical protein [Rhizobium sullae]TCU11213.1 hypothetical protein EV132_11883 [Rhizobium sullae]